MSEAQVLQMRLSELAAKLHGLRDKTSPVFTDFNKLYQHKVSEGFPPGMRTEIAALEEMVAKAEKAEKAAKAPVRKKRSSVVTRIRKGLGGTDSGGGG